MCALMNKEYQKLNKKVHQDSNADMLVVRGRSENKNQNGQERSRSSRKRYILKRISTLIVGKRAIERKIVPNWPKVRRSRFKYKRGT